MSMAIIGAVVAVGGATYGIVNSENQKSKAKRKQKELDGMKPRDEMPVELIKNQELAELRSKTGLPAEQYAMAQRAIQRQQSRTLRSASDRRMGLGLLASVDDNANRAQGNLDSQNAQARLNNERNLMGVNSQVASWKTAKNNRDLARWDNEYDYARAVEGSANQNKANSIMSGINAAGLVAGAAYKGASGNSNSSWASGLFGNGNRARRTTYIGGGTERQYYDANGNPVYNV